MIFKKVIASLKFIAPFIKQQLRFNTSSDKLIISDIKHLKQQWEHFGAGYSKFDMAPQTFYYSLLTLMNLSKADNILEVACGNARLIPVAVMLKKQQTKYLAVDLSENMIKRAQKFLQLNLQKYQSKLDYQSWCKKHNLVLKVANGEEKLIEKQKFDRIICNLVLMHTQNPQKMLKSLYDQAQKGCLLGISIWGNPKQNPFLNSPQQAMRECGLSIPNFRDGFHLYKKVGQLAENIGWKNLLRWQQNVIYPTHNFDMQIYGQCVQYLVSKLPQNEAKIVRQRIIQKGKQLFETKKGINFSVQLYLFEKD